MPPSSEKVRWFRFAVCFLLALLVWLAPAPEGLSREGWRVFAIFAGVVSGFLLRPIAMGPTVLLGLLALVAAKISDIKKIIADGFGDSTVWLVVLAFLIADAVEETGLGRRIALLLLRLLGRSVTGLAYAIAASELVLAQFIPSNTARGGGILAPIVHGLARTLGPTPRETPGEMPDGMPHRMRERGGAYLAQVGAHSNLVTSAMFLTAMAGNGQIRKPASELLGVDFNQATWLKGSIVPGLISLALLPLALRLIEPPGKIDTARVRVKVLDYLTALGRWKREEILLSLLLLVLLVLWYSLKDSATAVALLGVVLIVLGGIRTWKDLASSWRAWDALIWLGGFVALAEALKSSGFTDWFADSLRAGFTGWEPVTAAVVLALIYFASMYFFSQLTAHIAALAAAFFAVAASVGSPPLLTVALIAYFGCLCGTITPWSSGPVIIYFAQGYVSVGRWMRNGLCVGVFQIVLWLGVGMAWWRVLGWW